MASPSSSKTSEGRHHHAYGGGHTNDGDGTRGVQVRHARRDQAREQGGTGGDRTVHGRDKGTDAQGRKRVGAGQRPEQPQQGGEQGVGHGQALQQHAHEDIQRHGLQQIVFQQAQGAHGQGLQDRQVESAHRQAQRREQAGHADQQGPDRQAGSQNQHT
jgi:hypothetical protein